jgi:hypothetical protein
MSNLGDPFFRGAAPNRWLPFPDSRRQKAEVAAVCVKAGQRLQRGGRRALTQTALRLHSRHPGNGCEIGLLVAATAVYFDGPVISRDRRIRAASLKTIW